MKLNTNSNAYIIIYSAILVVIVAFLLAFVYLLAGIRLSGPEAYAGC